MFGSVVLEVIIGLTFIYLVLSLICTNINEWIATIISLRAKTLEKAIWSIVNDDAIVTEIYNHPAIRISALVERTMRVKKPSYIPAQSMAIALVDVIKARYPEHNITGPNRSLQQVRQGVDLLPDGPLKAMVKSVLVSNDDLAQLYKSLEQWFDSAMDRVSGWYKRKIQIISLAVAIFLAIMTNADSLNIINTLYQNSHMRVSIINSVSSNDYSIIQLPLGWEAPLNCHNLFDWLRKLAGWSFTAVAISLGSSFWFDLLNRFMNMRSSGKKPGDQSNSV